MKTHRGFAWPRLLSKLLHSLHLLSSVLAGQVLGSQSCPEPPFCRRGVATSLILFPRVISRRWGSSPGTSSPGLFLWGPPHPHLPHLPAPAVQAVGHRMSRMLQCQAGFLLAWHKPRELSSHHSRAAKHQASSIPAPKPSSSFRASTWQAASVSKCIMVHQCLTKTSARLWAH